MKSHTRSFPVSFPIHSYGGRYGFPRFTPQRWWAGLLALVLLVWGVAAPAAWALGGPQPAIGLAAPTFRLPATTGEGEVSLDDYRGQWVVLYFYPKDFTSGCTLEAKRFQQDLPKYRDRGAQILGVSADDTATHQEFCDAEGLTFPLLADRTGEVSQAYGSWMSPYSLRHTFLIDDAGIVREKFLGVRPVLHSAEVLERLDALQAARG